MDTHQPVIPRCIHFGTCGGCRLQDIEYSQQLAQKEKTVRDSLAPFLTDDVVFNPIIGCDPPWEYRNKMEFSFSSDKAGNKYLGLFMQKSRGRVLNITECHLTHGWFVDGLKAVREWWEASDLQAFHPYRHTGSLRTLIMREGKRTGDRLAMLTVSGNPDFALKKTHLDALVATLRAAIEPTDPTMKLSIFLRIQQVAKGMTTNFYEILLYGPDHIREVINVLGHSLTFRISPSAFFQPNTQQAEKLYSLALQMINIPAEGIVYDLYCGTSTLGICAAHQAKAVVGIEISPESVVDGRENIKLNGLGNITLIQGDVGKVLAERHKENHPLPDLVMVDPPRVGLDAKAIEHILHLKAPQLLYISCNPTTQSANLEVLMSGGYRLRAVQPVDQFPQTLHIENIAILTR